MSDIIWKRIIQSNVRASPVRSPYPCDSFHRLYAEHDRLWFLPRYKIWFCNRDLPGKMILVRYDDRRGCIEGLELLAVNKGTRYEQWQENNQVTIHTFEPIIRLHIDRPILQFKVGDRDEDGGFSVRPGANRFADEMPMVLDERLQGMFSNFLFNKPLAEEEATARLAKDYPYGDVWPPPAIPARQRTRGTISGRYDDSWLRAGDRPLRRDQVSENTFSIRRWIQRGGVPMPPLGAGTAFQFDWGNPDIIHMHMGEEIMTFATLDPALYTPTPTRPWRGIWVGDYSAHGCEFLLIHQPDEPEATDAELGLSREEWECDEAWEKRRLDARINRGRLEAIKLTGDPNVPRGEHTFIADDIGPDGFVGVASEPPFKGARMVRSRGHIAHTGFVEGESRVPVQFAAAGISQSITTN